MTPGRLPYGRQEVDEEDIAAVVSVLRGDWITQGPAVEAFEEALAGRCAARFAVAVSSGTAALHLACLAAGVGPGDYGITSPVTFAASANCIAYCGGDPGFADIETETATLSPAALRLACERRRPRVILPVDYAGQAANLAEIHSIGREFGAVIVEDAAHALGGAYLSGGEELPIGCGRHADMTVFSFHAVKAITTAEGGAVLTNDPDLAGRLRRLRSHGVTRDAERLRDRGEGAWYYEQQELGFNYRLTDLQCALGRSQLEKLDRFVRRRRELVECYRSALQPLAGEVSLLLERNGCRSAYHLLVARLSGGPSRRRKVFDRLRSQGIGVQVHYIPVHLHPWYQQRYGFRRGDFPAAEAHYDSCFSLPLFPGMGESDVLRVAGALESALAA